MMYYQITESVGRNGKNSSRDVTTVQNLLTIRGAKPGAIDGICGRRTIAAIESYQGGFLHHPDGLVSVHGKTWKHLVADLNPHQRVAPPRQVPIVPAPPVAPPPPRAPRAGVSHPWNKAAAVAYLNRNAEPHSLGRCARYVREAVEAGGVTLIRHESAKNYGSSLVAVGFVAVNTSTYELGDVAIIQPIPGHPHGHATMYNGDIWISDFRQNNGLYPGKTYRSLRPSFAIYRHP
jgi:peptidoglycan hydrolase-like protein with peptidoglycan-binding domain